MDDRGCFWLVRPAPWALAQPAEHGTASKRQSAGHTVGVTFWETLTLEWAKGNLQLQEYACNVFRMVECGAGWAPKSQDGAAGRCQEPPQGSVSGDRELMEPQPPVCLAPPWFLTSKGCAAPELSNQLLSKSKEYLVFLRDNLALSFYQRLAVARLLLHWYYFQRIEKK